MTNALTVNARRVLETIQQGCSGMVELRALPVRSRVFARITDGAGLTAFVQAHRETSHLYFGVATRRDGRSGRADNCQHLGALFADLDFGKSSEHDVRARLTSFAVLPSIVVHSGGGLHCYWALDAPLEVAGRSAEIKTILRRLARAVGGDLVVAEVARVLRLPQTLNFKHTPPVPVTVEIFEPLRRYALSAILNHLPDEPPPMESAIAVPLHWTPPAMTPDRYERGRAYLRAMGPAVEGSGGDQHTFKAAAWLINDLNLCESDALDLLREWNATCVPPWSDGELIAKLQHARRYGQHPSGAALIHDRPASSVTVRVRVS